jgi:hypothetical protein
VIVSQSIAFARHETKVSPRVKGGRSGDCRNRKYRFSPKGATLEKLHIFFVENKPLVYKAAIDNQ